MKYQASSIFAAALALSGGALAEFNEPIVGGETVSSPADYPWMVSLQQSGDFHTCGGFLIQENVIMTAAHCMAANFIGVRIKGNGLTAAGGELFTIKNIFRHEQYSSVSAGKDITLIELNPRADGTFTDVTPVAWDQSIDLHSGKTARAIGWGTLSEGGSTPTNLQQVDVPVRTNEECAEGYGSSVQPDMICAGVDEGGIDSCQGDSGGPLFLDGANPVVIGVVSWGQGCARPGFLGVYARIAELKPWVDEKLAIINAPPTPAPTPQPTEVGATLAPTSVCQDDPIGWYDSDGPTYTCAWYAEGTRCAEYGNAYNNPAFDNKNAKQACCVCGGGTTSRAVDVVAAEAPVCNCDGGEGYFDKCAYSLPWVEKALCIIDWRGGASMAPKCAVPEYVELKFSENYQRWVAVGCTPQPKLATDSVLPYDIPLFNQESAVPSEPNNGAGDGAGEVPAAATPDNGAAMALGGAAGGMVAAAAVFVAVTMYRKKTEEEPVLASFSV